MDCPTMKGRNILCVSSDGEIKRGEEMVVAGL
jgi:hypothetical protein